MIIAAKKLAGQNSAYRHRNMKGAFGNEGALPFTRKERFPVSERNVASPSWKRGHQQSAVHSSGEILKTLYFSKHARVEPIKLLRLEGQLIA